MPIVKHGHAVGGQSPEYVVWASMKTRCYSPNHRAYRYYGGRGISVCERWRGSFAAFFDDMGPRPAGCQLDRIDGNGNYEPGNCRWVTRKEQNNNTASCITLTHNGRSLRPEEWAAETGINRSTIYKRLKRGLPPSAVLAPQNFQGRGDIQWGL